MLERIRAWASLLRIGNCLIIGFAAFVGYFIGGGMDYWKGLMVFFAAASIGAWGNIVNDYFDIDVDRISKPWRPLPKGVIRVKTALATGIGLAITGLILSFMASIFSFIVALVAVVLLYLYSWCLKKLGIPGNITIALLSLFNILFGGLARVEPSRSLLPGLYAFLIILGR